MRYLNIYHRSLNVWIAVPSNYLEVVQKYCVVVTERTGKKWNSYYSYLMQDDCLLRLPGSFIQ